MINSLITLVFFKNNNNNNSLIILASVDWESQTKSKEKLDQQFKTWPKIKGKLSFGWVGKAQNLKNMLTSKCILYTVRHM